MSIVSKTFGVAGLVGVTPRRVQLTVTDPITTVQQAGYLTQAELLPDAVYPTDIFDIIYSYNTNTGTGTYAQMVPVISVGGSIQLYPALYPSNTTITLTPAQVNGAYAAPVLLIPAPPSGFGNVISYGLLTTVVGTAFANGGVGVLQYTAGAHGTGGSAITGTIPAAEITAASSQVYIIASYVQAGVVATSAISGFGIYFSNQTGAFTGGANSKLTFSLQYYTVPMA
ncbi:MAG: hypothetical protein EPO02_12760 [Nitrospirae bacterium]|nr:MAG: hypothetical protein EPO02_12760 [Nitrospirota bacterium]